MIELKETGFMSNRGRQNVASLTSIGVWGPGGLNPTLWITAPPPTGAIGRMPQVSERTHVDSADLTSKSKR